MLLVMFCAFEVSCGENNTDQAETADTEETLGDDYIVVGFSQLGAESDWRSANTQSMQETFSAANKYKLIFEDGQQKQANQITAIRNFIQQEVDYIVLAPVTETGWDTVLQEAKDAGIPIVACDDALQDDAGEKLAPWVGINAYVIGQTKISLCPRKILLYYFTVF